MSSPLPSSLPDIALVHEGDAWYISVEEKSPSTIRIRGVIQYPENRNATGIQHGFFDLSTSCREAVLLQVQRAYRGKIVQVQ